MNDMTGFDCFGGVSIRPVIEQDIPWLYEMETHPAILQRFRLNGVTPSPRMYAEFYTRGSSTAYIAFNVDSGQRIGMIYTFGTDANERRTSVGVVAHPEMHGVGRIYRGLYILADYLFNHLNIDRIFIQAAEFNITQYSAGNDRRLDLSKLFEAHAVLREDTYMGGRWWDKYVLSVSKGAFFAHQSTLRSQVELDYESEKDRRPILERHGSSAATTLERAGMDANPLETPHARMRAVKDTDLHWISHLFSTPQNRGSMRLAMLPPIAEVSGELLEGILWENILCQFVVEDRANEIPLALVSASNVVWNNLYLSASVAIVHGMLGDEAIAAAVRKFIDYIFATFCIRKIYLQAREGDDTFEFLKASINGGIVPYLRDEGGWSSGWPPFAGSGTRVSSISRSDWCGSAEM